MRYLYSDMDSSFTNVEHQVDPRLRRRLVAVTALESNVRICVAASLEAKALGVRTGIPVYEAQLLCPQTVLRLG